MVSSPGGQLNISLLCLSSSFRSLSSFFLQNSSRLFHFFDMTEKVAHRAEVRSAKSQDVVPKLSKALPKLHPIFLKVIPSYLKVVSKLPSCSSQLVPKCCPCSFQMEPCDLQLFPSAALVLSLKFQSGAKGSRFMLPCGHEMC